MYYGLLLIMHIKEREGLYFRKWHNDGDAINYAINQGLQSF